jgi:hypothetical protein
MTQFIAPPSFWESPPMSTPARDSLFVVLTLLLLSSASCSKSTTVNWPGVPFHEVRLYAYNFVEPEPKRVGEFLMQPGPYYGELFNDDGSMVASVINPDGVVLNDEQQGRLLKILQTPKEQTMFSGCAFNPRHAVVFYDEAGKRVSLLRVCFECMQFGEEPKAYDRPKQSLDYGALADFMEEMGLPVFMDRSKYKEYARDLEQKKT